jgi:hypothetical protein
MRRARQMPAAATLTSWRRRSWEDERVSAVTRLLTLVDIDDADDDGPDARRMSVSARHEAVLADGRRVVLLEDRGWSESLSVVWADEPSEQDRRLVEVAGIWATETAEEMKRTARDVVGPDEPFEGRTHADMEASHWEALAQMLRTQGVYVETAELKALPHDVELSDRVLARIGRGKSDARRDEQ